tara:strand:+ start:182 stop:811 length:630 start_codon:yes stop_codon:yes gene_type:complete
LPWSLSRTDDDKTLSEEQAASMFDGKEVVVTEKLDGENTTIYSDGKSHARSIDSVHHESRSVIKLLAAKISHELPEGWRLMGENLFAKHSISYDELDDHFVLFGIADQDNNSLSWDEVVQYGEMLELTTAPVLYRGVYDEQTIKALWPRKSAYGADAEGYVVRNADGFALSDFASNVAKFVRKGHVQTDDHWMHQSIVPNLRKDGQAGF